MAKKRNPNQTEEQYLDTADPQSREDVSSPANRGLHIERRLVSTSESNSIRIGAIVLGIILLLGAVTLAVNAMWWGWTAALAVLGGLLLLGAGYHAATTDSPRPTE